MNNSIDPIYKTLRNRFLLRKIVSYIPHRYNTITAGEKWRWKYHHYQTLSDILKTPYHGMILDKLKTKSLVITNECIVELVKMPNIDFKLFHKIYQAKQWMFKNEDLLFHAVESGSMEKITLLASQEYPRRLLRVRDGELIEKINIIGHAFQTLQFDLYEFLFYQSTITDIDGKKLKDMSVEFKSEALMSSLLKLKDISYLKRVVHSSNDTNNTIEKDLYRLKLEIQKMDPNIRSIGLQLLSREDGIHLLGLLFPKFKIPTNAKRYILENYVDDFTELRGIEDIYFYSSVETNSNRINSCLDIISTNRYQTYLPLGSSSDGFDKFDNPNVKKLVKLLHVLLCMDHSMRMYNSGLRLIREIIQCCGQINIGTHMILRLLELFTTNVLFLNLFKYGSMEQVEYTLGNWQERMTPIDIRDCVIGSMYNSDPEIFKYLLQRYGFTTLMETFLEDDDVTDLSIDTRERLQFSLLVDRQLKSLSMYYVQPKRLTKQYLLDIAEFMRIDPQHRTTLFIFDCVTLEIGEDIGHSGDGINIYDENIEIIRILVDKFRNSCTPILKAVLHSLHYRYIMEFIVNDLTLIDEITDTIGYLGDFKLFDLLIGYLSNKQLQKVIFHACQSGSLSLLDHCKSKYPERSNWKKSTDIIKLGRLDIIQYYLDTCQQSKVSLLELLLDKAITEDQLDIYSYLINHQLLSNEMKGSILNNLASLK